MKMRYRNFYRCECGAEWNDEWDSQCNDECPNCGTKDIQPYKSEDIGGDEDTVSEPACQEQSSHFEPFITEPHAAQEVRLLEDSMHYGYRIYLVREREQDSEHHITMTGEEPDSLAEWWRKEKARIG